EVGPQEAQAALVRSQGRPRADQPRDRRARRRRGRAHHGRDRRARRSGRGARADGGAGRGRLTMRGALKAVVAIVVVLIALAVVHMLVLDSQPKPAAVTADGGSIESASSVDLQVFDSPATGSGPEGAPIVLLHCFACSSQWWNPILPALNENHRVIRIDLIGHGGSEKPQGGYEIDAQGAAVAEAL